MTTKKRDAMHQRIEAHGKQLLAIFPNATERDPVKLCKKLRRLEARGAAFGLRLCNGPEFASEDEQDDEAAAIMASVGDLLQFQSTGVPVILNRDPRGYALKIDGEWLNEQRANHRTAYKASIHRDWGGYGIIAPDLSEGE